MKKLLFWLCFMSFLLLLQVFADDGTRSIYIPMKENNIEVSVGDIALTFCNEDNKAENNNNLIIDTNPNEKKEICMNIKNNTNTDVKLDVWFVDGTFTNDKEPRKACKNKIDKERFGNYVLGDDETVFIQANSSITLKKEVLLGDEHIGLNNGCVVYSIADTKPLSAWWMAYRVILRKAWFIDVTVSGTIISNIVFKTQWWWNNLKESDLMIVENENTVDLYVTITNEGNIPMIVSGSWTLTDIFGKTLDIGSWEIRILPKETRELHFTVDKERRWYFNLFGIKPSVSRYRTLYYGKVNISYNPITINQEWDWINANENQTLTATAFLMPRWIVVLVILIIVYYITQKIKKKYKKHKNRWINETSQNTEESEKVTW